MVVGDDAQSIYSWRGANFQNILEFPNRYPKAQMFRIELNYRSVPEILEVANRAIAGQRQAVQKEPERDARLESDAASAYRTERWERTGAIRGPTNPRSCAMKEWS